MRQLSTVFKFELMNFYKNKIFISITIVAALLIAIVLSFPRIMELFDNNDSSIEENVGENIEDSEAEKETIALMDTISDDPQTTVIFLMKYLQGYNIVPIKEDVEKIKQDVKDKIYKSAIIIDGVNSYTFIVNDKKMGNSNYGMIDSALQQKRKLDIMQQKGISMEDASSILSSYVSSEVLTVGKDQTQSFLYTYIIIFILYFAIIMYGNLIATSVATEKSSRAMEMLITSAKPTNLIFGKVFGSGFAGLSQLAIIFVTSFVFYKINYLYWQQNEIINMIFSMNLDYLLYSLLFFILGFFIYAFLFGALGSLANRTEDINVSTMPITLTFVVAFILVMNSMVSGNVDNMVMKVCSYIPFTSPMAMFARITMGNVPVYGVILSIVILIGSTILIGLISARIYKMGVLLYGKTINIKEYMKIRKQKF
ncbi:ABC transporter permease [Sedimentibacter sp. zth1]|uniref:ABC transporter permease n=1 Tax=Sedimentibacter sp. zth1 TaxID=2816908 RepID=UPI001A926BB4|nr:ABC transporter permease [Sedimentibacter sp. zth1]QSX04968.1 ABC transporter permease [Sedimentibacter sp. zth1]